MIRSLKAHALLAFFAVCVFYVCGFAQAAHAATLIPGSGFSGVTSQPAVIGEGDGADEKAIARWDVVPFQTATSTINVGVVAFHMNGIQKVSFSVEGGPWTDVAEMALNPETGVVEYWATLRASDFADGRVEVRAIAYPVVGVPRVLAGEMALESVSNGEHSLFLYTNAYATLPTDVIYVSVSSGSDTVGDGSINSPYATPGRAITQYYDTHSQNADGLTVYLDAGEYAFQGYPFGNARKINNGRWITLTAWPGRSREEVVISSSVPNGFAINAIRVKNVTVINNVSIRAGDSGGDGPHIWLDSIATTGAAGIVNTLNWVSSYVTDSVSSSAGTGLRSFTLVRNVLFSNVIGTPLGAPLVAVNVTIDGQDIPDGSDAHADIWHYWSYDGEPDFENVINYGITATGIEAAQPIFMENNKTGGLSRIDNVAFVDVSMGRSSYGPSNSWWEMNTSHLLLWNVDMGGSSGFDMRWKLSDYGASVSGVSIDNSSFHWFTHDELPLGTRVRNLDVVSGYAPIEYWPTDFSVPIISGESPSGSLAAGTSQATLVVSTNEPATCKYGTVAGTAYASLPNTFSSTGGTSHSTAVSGLSGGTAYTYYVRCSDGLGNANATDYGISFSVAAGSSSGSSRRRSSGGGGGRSSRAAPAPAQPAARQAPAYAFMRDLAPGSEGPDVAALQDILIARGYLIMPPGIAKGYFGNLTQAALMKYQQAQGIAPASGYFGPLTRTSLSGMPASAAQQAIAPQQNVAPTTIAGLTQTLVRPLTLPLSLGSQNGDVLLLQQFLISRGFLPAGNATGYFGPLTRAAVGQFQVSQGIAASAADPNYGLVGPATRGRVNALAGVRY